MGNSKLTPADLLSLEEYARQRNAIRREVMEHKKLRKLPIGPHLTLYFEDRRTMQYQIQEMLRIERISENDGIQDELDAYNPLIPNGANWKVTMMLEFPDVEERRRRLRDLKGLENTLHIQVEGFEPVYAICNEDLKRTTDEMTASVHFGRFEFTPELIEAMKSGAGISAAVRHDAYPHGPVEITGEVRESLLGDFD